MWPPPQQQQFESYDGEAAAVAAAAGSPPNTAALASSEYQQQQQDALLPPPGYDGEEEEPFVSRTLYFCRLPSDFTEETIYEACARFGEVRRITPYQSRQIAFVEYWDIRDAQKARHGLKTLTVSGRTVDVQYSKTQNERAREKNTGTLYVRPMTLERHFQDPNTLMQYKELFGRFGDVKKVNTNRKREAEKFIEFHDLRHAERALEALNGFSFNGVKLEVQFANQSSKTVSASAIAGSTPGGKQPGLRREASPSQIFANNGKITTTPSNWGVPCYHASWRGVQGPAVSMALGSGASGGGGGGGAEQRRSC